MDAGGTSTKLLIVDSKGRKSSIRNQLCTDVGFISQFAEVSRAMIVFDSNGSLDFFTYLLNSREIPLRKSRSLPFLLLLLVTPSSPESINSAHAGISSRFKPLEF
jgi:hypothetical protein